MTNKITKNRLNSMGLKEEDYNEIIYLLGREPTLTEVAIYSAMWSEHCSYKSSRHWLKELPCEAKYVIQGPGGVLSDGAEATRRRRRCHIAHGVGPMFRYSWRRPCALSHGVRGWHNT